MIQKKKKKLKEKERESLIWFYLIWLKSVIDLSLGNNFFKKL